MISRFESVEKQFAPSYVGDIRIHNELLPIPLVVRYSVDGESFQKIAEIPPRNSKVVRLAVLPGSSCILVETKEGVRIGDPVYLVYGKQDVFLATIAFDNNEPWDASYENLHADIPSVRVHNLLPFDIQFRHYPGGIKGSGRSNGKVVGIVGSHGSVYFDANRDGLNVADVLVIERMDGKKIADVTIPTCYLRDLYVGANVCQ